MSLEFKRLDPVAHQYLAEIPEIQLRAVLRGGRLLGAVSRDWDILVTLDTEERYFIIEASLEWAFSRATEKARELVATRIATGSTKEARKLLPFLQTLLEAS